MKKIRCGCVVVVGVGRECVRRRGRLCVWVVGADWPRSRQGKSVPRLTKHAAMDKQHSTYMMPHVKPILSRRVPVPEPVSSHRRLRFLAPLDEDASGNNNGARCCCCPCPLQSTRILPVGKERRSICECMTCRRCEGDRSVCFGQREGRARRPTLEFTVSRPKNDCPGMPLSQFGALRLLTHVPCPSPPRTAPRLALETTTSAARPDHQPSTPPLQLFSPTKPPNPYDPRQQKTRMARPVSRSSLRLAGLVVVHLSSWSAA